MNIGTKVYIMIIGNSLTTRYKGIISSIALQTIPALNINKGDYWINVDGLSKIILGKKKNTMDYKGRPIFVFQEKSE